MDLELDHWGLTNALEEEKVKFVGTYIQGEAGKWWEPMLRSYLNNPLEDREERVSEIFNNYGKLKEYMKKAFGDLNEKLAAERQIRECKQRTAVWRYNTEFIQTMSHLEWDEDAKMAQYRTGLKPEAKNALIYFETDAKSLDQLMERAQLVDRRMFDSKMENRVDRTTMRSGRNKNTIRPEIKRDREGDVIMVGAKAIDKNECRKNKLCFNCGKPNHIAKNCRNRKPQKSDFGKDANSRLVQSRMANVVEEAGRQTGFPSEHSSWEEILTNSEEEGICQLTGDPGCTSDCDCRNLNQGDDSPADKENYDPDNFHKDLSKQQKAEWETADKIGITNELEELWWYQFNAEKTLGLNKKEAAEKVRELEWVTEAIHEKMKAQQRQKNNKLMCKRTCPNTLKENLLNCLCFCRRHREECPVHEVVSTLRWEPIKNPDPKETETDHPDESKKDDDGEAMTSEKDTSTEPREPRQKLSEILSDADESSSKESDDNKDCQEKGRLQDNTGSELHDKTSQKNMSTRAPDRSELADKRSDEKVAIARGPASEELERNPQRLRPVPTLARRRAMNELWKESSSMQMSSQCKVSAGSRNFDQWYQGWTRERRQNPLGSEEWFDECWQRDRKRCNCYLWMESEMLVTVGG
jgi:Retrotransposon gag protein/Zinc knuckle